MARQLHERLSPADASNVVMDARDQVNTFLMAGLLGQGGFIDSEGIANLPLLRSRIAVRLAEGQPGLRRFAQRVAHEGQSPVWEPCVPDLTWHVRTVPSIEGTVGLAALCADLMTTPLPVDRPLWELLLVPGAAPRGLGLVLRVHHAVADGVAGVRLVQHLFDPEPTPDPAPPPAAASDPAPPPAPTPDPVSQPAPDPAPQPKPEPRTTPPPQPHRTTNRRPWHGLASSVSRVTAVFRSTIPPTILLGPIGPRRGVAFTEVDLGRLAAGARAAGGTVNDALLAGVAAAAESALRGLGEPVPSTLPASVPVALPDRGASGNAVGVMLVRLPTGTPDVAARLSTIASTTRTAKDEARSLGTYELTRTRWGSRLFGWLARRQRFIALFVTNVRGPAEPLRLAGAPLERAWPVAPIQGNVRLGVAAFSYAGRLGCAIHVDAAALPADALGSVLGAELDRITLLAG